MDQWIVWGAIIAGGLWGRHRSFFTAFWALMTVMLAIYCGVWSSNMLAGILSAFSGVLGAYTRSIAMLTGAAIALLVFYKAGLEREEGNLDRYVFPKHFRWIAPVLCGMLAGRFLAAFLLLLLCFLPCRSMLEQYCNFPEVERYSAQTVGTLSGIVDGFSFQGGNNRRKALEEMLNKQQENSNPDAELDAQWAKARAARNSQQPAEEKTAAESGNAAAKTAPAADSRK